MNYTKKMEALLPGKILTYVTLLLLFFNVSAIAQTATPCRVDFDYTIDHQSKAIKLEAKSNQSPAKFYWDFGDGTAGEGKEVKHQYRQAGKYKVCVKSVAFNSSTNKRCTTSECKEITIVDCDRLEAKFVYEIEGYTLKVKGKSNDANAKAGYTFGDGSAERGYEVKHTFDKPGTYAVCLIVKDTVYGCFTEVCKRITIEPKRCDLEGDYRYETSGLGLKVKAKANERNLHYFWTFGDGTDATGIDAKHQYKKEGVYEVCLIIFNPVTKCKVCICKKILIEKPCDLRAKIKMRSDGKSIWVKARSNASDNSTYYWTFGDGSYARGEKAKHTYSKPGTYTVSLLAIDSKRNCRKLVEKRVLIGPNSQLTNKDEVSSNQSALSSRLGNDEVVINELEATWNANVLPSPAISSISFESNDAELALVTITDLSGTEIIQSTETLQNLDISTLSKGIYYARITAADGTQKTVKFIKN